MKKRRFTTKILEQKLAETAPENRPDWDCSGLSSEEIWEKIYEGEKAIDEGRYVTLEELDRHLAVARQDGGRRVCVSTRS